MGFFKILFLVLIFVCLIVGFVFVFMPRMFVSKKKNNEQNYNRKLIRTKLIGCVLMLLAIAFALFRSLII